MFICLNVFKHKQYWIVLYLNEFRVAYCVNFVLNKFREYSLLKFVSEYIIVAGYCGCFAVLDMKTCEFFSVLCRREEINLTYFLKSIENIYLL